jgi:Holliday junction resolvase RusA-like endonuclease
LGLRFALKKPDVDNVAKLVMDALEGYAYRADAAIADLRAVKLWGSPARTEVVLSVIAESEAA